MQHVYRRFANCHRRFRALRRRQQAMLAVPRQGLDAVSSPLSQALGQCLRPRQRWHCGLVE
ncbi:hypothetical protein IP87_17425 [beta proteobacterium AAP121]|nr:hypothetical protein IP87_17425 [beta proteobacterium AAP121]